MFNFSQRRIEKANAEAERVLVEAEARELGIFDAAIAIKLAEVSSPEKFFKRIHSSHGYINKKWDKYKIQYLIPTYDDLNFPNCWYTDVGFGNPYDDSEDWNVVIVQIGINTNNQTRLESDMTLYAAAREYKRGVWQGQEKVRCFHNGEWVEHFFAHAKNMQAEYGQKQLGK